MPMFDVITRFSSARILVVDDSVFERRLISLALKKSGFTYIETADDGAEAVLKTQTFRPDMVLLDINMPNLDGFGYCEMVRNDSSLPRMPIIVQTAQEDRQSRLRALSCGADDFLTKPLDMDELSLRICLHMERYFMQRDLQDMCTYLRMEVEGGQVLRKNIQDVGETGYCIKGAMERHYEVLDQMLHLPAVG